MKPVVELSSKQYFHQNITRFRPKWWEPKQTCMFKKSKVHSWWVTFTQRTLPKKTKMAHASFPRLKKKQVSLDDMAVMVWPRTKKSSHHTMHSYTIALQRTLAKNVDASSTWRVQDENDQNRKISRAWKSKRVQHKIWKSDVRLHGCGQYSKKVDPLIPENYIYISLIVCFRWTKSASKDYWFVRVAHQVNWIAWQLMRALWHVAKCVNMLHPTSMLSSGKHCNKYKMSRHFVCMVAVSALFCETPYIISSP